MQNSLIVQDAGEGNFPLNRYKNIWCADFGYGPDENLKPDVRCMVAIEFYSKRTIKLWRNELSEECPLEVGTDSLFVAYYASAELNCFQQLGWDLPENVLDLCVMFRYMTSGHTDVAKHSLLDCLKFCDIEGISHEEKEEMRDLAIRGGKYSDTEKTALLDYCEQDVIALIHILPKMAGIITERHICYWGAFFEMYFRH